MTDIENDTTDLKHNTTDIENDTTDIKDDTADIASHSVCSLLFHIIYSRAGFGYGLLGLIVDPACLLDVLLIFGWLFG